MGLAFLITTDNLQLLSERKVLKQAEYAALLDAQAVIDAARSEAQRIVQAATRQADELRRQGYEDGFQAAKGAYADKLLEAAIGSQSQLQGVRNAMAGLLTKAVQQFILDADPGELFAAALLRVDTLIRNEPFVNVRIAPRDEATFRQVLSRMSVEAAWAMTVSVQADPSLPEGACILQTASGTLEIGVDAQMQAFQRAIERSVSQSVG